MGVDEPKEKRPAVEGAAVAEAVVAAAATGVEPKEKMPADGAAGVAAVAAVVDGADVEPKENSPAAGAAVDDADEAPNEKRPGAADGVAAGAAEVLGAAGAGVAADEPKENKELDDDDVAVETGAAVVAVTPNAAGMAADVEDAPNVLVDGGTAADVVVATPNAGAAAPKFKDVGYAGGLAAEKLNSGGAAEAVVALAAVKLGNDDSEPVAEALLEATPNAMGAFSAELSTLANENGEGAEAAAVVVGVPNENPFDKLVVAAGIGTAGVVPSGFLPRISITLPVASVDTVFGAAEGLDDDDDAAEEPKLKIGFDLDAAVVVVDADEPEPADDIAGSLKNDDSLFGSSFSAGREKKFKAAGAGSLTADALNGVDDSSLGLSPNLNPAAGTSTAAAAVVVAAAVFGFDSAIDLPKLNPAAGDSVDFVVVSRVAPNLKPPDSATGAAFVSKAAPNLNPLVDSFFSSAAPN